MVAIQPAPRLRAGDSVTILGTTVGDGFFTNIRPTALLPDGPGAFPKPIPVRWRELINSTEDSTYVSLTGQVRSATVQFTTGRADRSLAQSDHDGEDWIEGRRRYILMDVQTDGGIVRVHMERPRNFSPLSLLDCEVRIEGVAGGIFDGRYQQIGAELWVSTGDHLHILKPPASSPAALPLTEMRHIMADYRGTETSPRVHVRGSVTFYQPGIQMTLQTDDGQAVLVNSWEQSPLQLGQIVDAVGFPDPHGYSEVLGEANILPSPSRLIIPPVATTWPQAQAGHYPYGLISLEGRLAAEVHEPHQDTLVIKSGGHVFSAMLPRTVWNRDVDAPALPEYHVGSKVRVTGVCFVHAGGPWNTERWFDLELRSNDDIVELAPPSWWTVRHLFYLAAVLLLFMIAALLWAMLLQGKLRRQALIEKERARVLEAINSSQKLDDVLLMILHLIASNIPNAQCWCELASGMRVAAAPESTGSHQIRRSIVSANGDPLGTLVLSATSMDYRRAGVVLETAAGLAALAIDNRRLYETLMHRSQYDQLTNVANRFLLETRFDEALDNARQTRNHCAIVYIDLNAFKKVNDFFGHRVGDAYLQQVAERLSESLRSMDTLARIGGDEFIALIPLVRNRAEVMEIIQRLMHCFDTPFEVQGRLLEGGASIGAAIYPDDGLTKEELKRVADADMYSKKPHAAV
ncbi:MAG TPA: GGDEF domain-containing protein [Acidobacteriaceae bacterium]|nr:GGDEF domain-containing protein [Acidobacteriaceae bacterium]